MPLTSAELAAALHVTAPTVNAWAKAGQIPYSQVGRRRLFDLNEVLAATKRAAQRPRLAVVPAQQHDDFSELRQLLARGAGAQARTKRKAARR